MQSPERVAAASEKMKKTRREKVAERLEWRRDEGKRNFEGQRPRREASQHASWRFGPVLASTATLPSQVPVTDLP